MDCQTAAVFSHVLCPLLFLKGNGADIDVTYKIAALQEQEVTAWNAGIGLLHLFPFSGKGDVGSLACAPVAHLGVEFSRFRSLDHHLHLVGLSLCRAEVATCHKLNLPRVHLLGSVDVQSISVAKVEREAILCLVGSPAHVLSGAEVLARHLHSYLYIARCQILCWFIFEQALEPANRLLRVPC